MAHDDFRRLLVVPYRPVCHQQIARAAGFDILQSLSARIERQMIQHPETDNQVVTAWDLLNNIELLYFRLARNKIKRRVRCASKVGLGNPVQIASTDIGNGLNAVLRYPIRDCRPLRLCFFES